MNIDPDNCKFTTPPPPLHPARPYVILMTALAVLLLFLLLFSSGGSGAGAGSGSGAGTGSGVGPGTGTGTGNGAGNGAGNGDGAGSGDGRTSGTGPGRGGERSSASPAPSVSAGDRGPTAVVPGRNGPPASAVSGPGGPESKASDLAPTLPVRPDDFTASWKAPVGAPPPPVSGGAGGGGGKSGFYGIGVSGKADVIFLVDVSGSMAGESLETLKRELWKSLRPPAQGSLLAPDEGTFRIVAFSTGTQVYPAEGPGIPFREAAHATGVIRFISGLSAGGGTNMTAAWKQVLEILKKHPAQVIYTLSDGAPTDGDPCELVKRELHPEIVVHAVAIGNDSELMRRLAREHGGKYVQK